MTKDAVRTGVRETPTMALLRARKAEILRVAQAHGASNIRVFGSVARGDAGPDSDIDLLVDFEESRSLVDEVGLEQDLAALLGHPVDVGENVHRVIRERVRSEAVPL